MRRHVLALDLADDPATIAAYDSHHRAVWPEVARSLRAIGIAALDIYRLGSRLVMVMDVPAGFDRRRSFARHLASHPRCAEWEALMKSFQRRAPGARPDEWWAEMAHVFRLRPARSRAALRRSRAAARGRAPRGPETPRRRRARPAVGAASGTKSARSRRVAGRR
jgi:L-rhamnose mutarotase